MHPPNFTFLSGTQFFLTDGKIPVKYYQKRTINRKICGLLTA